MVSRAVWHAEKLLLPLVAGGLFFLTGCPGETTPPKTTGGAKVVHADGDDDHDDHDHHHHHAEKGPHDGALVAIGHDDAHLEFVLDGDTGTLKAYVLDGEAEKAVAIKQGNLQVTLTIAKGDDTDALPDDAAILMLAAVSPGEDGKASEFEGQADGLKGVEKFSANLTSVSVAGKQFKNVAFKYPEGNEEDHHHH